ncbi:hypothetical protein XENOCAPTIV_006640, partial [Xenoophorus captivus]
SLQGYYMLQIVVIPSSTQCFSKHIRDAETNTLSPLLQRRPRPPPVPQGAEDDEDVDEDEDDDEGEEEEEEVVVALYDFPGLESHDLKLVRGCEYVILEKCDANWYKARNQYGSVFRHWRHFYFMVYDSDKMF